MADWVVDNGSYECLRRSAPQARVCDVLHRKHRSGDAEEWGCMRFFLELGAPNSVGGTPSARAPMLLRAWLGSCRSCHGSPQ